MENKDLEGKRTVQGISPSRIKEGNRLIKKQAMETASAQNYLETFI